jgi:hypothetical protein
MKSSNEFTKESESGNIKHKCKTSKNFRKLQNISRGWLALIL